MQYIEAANHWVGREGCQPKFLILHGTAGGTSALAIADYFAGQAKDPNTGSSANYVIGTAGEVVQCVLDTDAPWANGPLTVGHQGFWDAVGVNPNLVSIAIEHCKPSQDNSDGLTPIQQQASFALVEQLCDKWGIPKRWADANGGITGHFSTDPVNRSRCPGPYPWDALFAYLNRKSTPSSPAPSPSQPTKEPEDMLQLTDPLGSYFAQTGTAKWTCKQNKIDVQGAILVYYRIIYGACRLPKAPEQYNIPGVVWQPFESGILVYDPQQKLDGFQGHNHTYLIKTDSDLAQKVLFGDKLKAAQDATTQALTEKKASDDKVVALTKEVADLKATQPINRDQLKTDLNAISTAVATALKTLN